MSNSKDMCVLVRKWPWHSLFHGQMKINFQLKHYVAIGSSLLQGGLAMGGPEASECEDEALYGREYLDWKKQTLGTQVGCSNGMNIVLKDPPHIPL